MPSKWAIAVALLGAVQAFPPPPRGLGSCPPVKPGNIVVHQQALYPENADFDAARCLTLFGSLFNASVAVYDPYQNKVVDSWEFPGISHNPALHLGGVAWDPYTDLISIVVDAANPFNTAGADVSGDNFIMRFDPVKKKVLWNLNITAVSQGKYGGFQDIEHDPRGHVYVVGTYPASIMRVEVDGSAVKPWYLPDFANTTKAGTSGLAAVGDILLASDMNGGAGTRLLKFDTKAAVGTPVVVPVNGNITIGFTDAIYLPPKYQGRVLLVTENALGIHVLRSKDGSWTSADYLGLVSNNIPEAAGAIVTAIVQQGDRIYMVEEYFADPFAPGQVAGNRTDFPLPDITDKVAKLVAAC